MLNRIKTAVLTHLIGRTFRQRVLDYFGSAEMRTMTQRIDGIRCFAPDPIGGALFLNLRLSLMVKMGDLRCVTGRGIWKSTRGMPWYGLSEKA